MGRTILVFGRTGSGKTTSIKYQGGPAKINSGAESDTSDVRMYDTANGDRAIDMPGLHDTRAIDAKDNTYNDEAILRKLLTFLTAQKIDTIHGINWHLQPATRIDEHIKREAKFINDLVGREGWKNVVVLIVDDLRPRHEPPIRAAIDPYTSYDALPIRGCVLDEEAASVKSISLYENQPMKNAETLAGLRISHRPIQICILDEECTVCRSTGDHRIYGRCHSSIQYKHASEIIAYNHIGGLVTHPHVGGGGGGGPSNEIEKVVVGLFGGRRDDGKRRCGTAGCGKVFHKGSSGVCYRTWARCGCVIPPGKVPSPVQKGGCSTRSEANKASTCGGCGRRTNTSGCIAFCSKCKRHQADVDFAQNGCASASVDHVLRRRA